MSAITMAEFRREFERCTMHEDSVDLPGEILEGRCNLLFVLNQLMLGRLTVNELNQSYIFLAGLLLGKYPKIAFSVNKEDRIRLPYAALEQLPASKGKLTSREKVIFAFCAFHSVCIEVYDEKTHELHKGIKDLTSPERVIDLLMEEMDNHPERFAFLQPQTTVKSSAPFGTSRENPIQAVSIADGYDYLNRLCTPDGRPVKYERIGSMSGISGGIIDGYRLELGGTKTMTVYIDPYSPENSTDAPEGLMLYDDDFDDDDGDDDFDDDDDYDEPDAELEQLIIDAEAGDGQAQLQLGFRYYDGDGVPQSYSKALKYYRLAAEQGYLSAITNIGLMYSRGLGVEKDASEAARWYASAADDDFPEALHNLACLYAEGRGVRQNTTKAFELWHRAAEQGYCLSQFRLGLEYARKGDRATARKWLEKAASQGYLPAKRAVRDLLG